MNIHLHLLLLWKWVCAREPIISGVWWVLSGGKPKTPKKFAVRSLRSLAMERSLFLFTVQCSLFSFLSLCPLYNRLLFHLFYFIFRESVSPIPYDYDYIIFNLKTITALSFVCVCLAEWTLCKIHSSKQHRKFAHNQACHLFTLCAFSAMCWVYSQTWDRRREDYHGTCARMTRTKRECIALFFVHTLEERKPGLLLLFVDKFSSTPWVVRSHVQFSISLKTISNSNS